MKHKEKNADSHIVLYAKHYYKIGDVMDDLKVLVSHRSGVAKEHISDWDVFLTVFDIAHPFIRDKAHWVNIIRDVFYGPTGFPTLSLERLVKRFVFGVLQLIQVKDNIGVLYELDKPDYNILPKKEKE